MKKATETVENEISQQKGWFLGILLLVLGGNGVLNPLIWKGVIRTGEGTVRTEENVWCLLILWKTSKLKGILKIKDIK